MKYIWLMGGFGNTLFQILASRVIKQNNNAKFVAILTEKNYITKLMGWMIHEKLYKDFIKGEEFQKIGLLRASVLLFVSLISRKFGVKNLISTFYTNQNRFEEPYATNIFGYFQDKYFLERNRDELLRLGKDIYKQYQTKESYIVVHYRMGDSGWARQYESYYTQVKALIKKENSKVLIATDSPKEALDFFSDCDNVVLTDAKNAMEDFKYMVSASKLYCAPSTFSWWAAHALPDTSMVIMPRFFKETLGIYISEKNLLVIGQ